MSTAPKKEPPTLEVRDLQTRFHTRAGVLAVVNGRRSGAVPGP